MSDDDRARIQAELKRKQDEAQRQAIAQLEAKRREREARDLKAWKERNK